MASEILTETRGPIGIVRINRPTALNALNQATFDALVDALQQFDANGNVRSLLLTGDERAFAAGIELRELIDASMVELEQRDPLRRWDDLARLRKPLVSAVSGYALGTGCELVLASDVVIAAESARFGMPQLSIGIMPGGGGTQRLIRAVGRARAMDLILTGRTITAGEALTMGLVSRVVPPENCLEAALTTCEDIARRPPLAVRLAKEAVNQAAELPLSDGMKFERHLHYLLFATDDQKEGLRAFLEKRPPIFAGR